MISLFRFLFYLISVMVRRLDHLWHVGDFYYLWGGYICSGILFIFLLFIWNITVLLGITPISWLDFPWMPIVPFAAGTVVCVILGKDNKASMIYAREKARNKRYKIVMSVLVVLFISLAISGWFITNGHIHSQRCGIPMS